MLIEELKQIFNEKNEVHFKLYALKYTIKKENDKVIIFADLYPNRNNIYSSIDELLNNYTVYNENLIDNQQRIEKIV